MCRLLFLVIFLVGLPALHAHAKTLSIFAAASTVQILDEIRGTWNAANRIKLSVVYGSSGALARQIENGAPADIYFSANSIWVDHLAKTNLVRNSTRKTIFRNRLVLIAPASSQFSKPFDLATDILGSLGPQGRLAIGDPRHVPAGIYTRQALSHLGLWSKNVQRTVWAPNVRLALALVERGAAELGIVYYTDAIQTRRVRILSTIDHSLHAPIGYQAVATATARPGAEKLLEYLGSNRSRAIYSKFGFLTP